MALVKTEGLTFTYLECESPAIADIELTIERGSFNVLAGSTGCGKSTLLRLLKRELAPLGDMRGEIFFDGARLCELSDKDSVSRIGFVMQSVDAQIVCDKVWHELVFVLESLGRDKGFIAFRAAETASYFGIDSWYERDTASLSGGQKQLLNLASVMMCEPQLLILDEPTAQLDPIAASEFIHTVKKLCDELGLTVLIAEHRLDELIPLCDKLFIMEKGRLIHSGAPAEVISRLDEKSPIAKAMPAAARLYKALGAVGELPLTVSKGRQLAARYDNKISALQRKRYTHADEKALELKDVYFRFERNSPDILKGLTLDVYKGEIFCVLGANGSGKSTAAKCISALLKPYSGSIKVFGKRLKEYKNRTLYTNCLTLVPQDVQTCFLYTTVKEELDEAGISLDELPFDMSEVLNKHPYDLSGGEQQLLALAKALGSKPRLLILDEATKGMDASLKLKTAEILKELKGKGVTLLVVTHDIEFAALCADRCAMFFGGEAVSVLPPYEFFDKGSFYTTAASRIARGQYEGVVTVDDLAAICLKNEKKVAR